MTSSPTRLISSSSFCAATLTWLLEAVRGSPAGIDGKGVAVAGANVCAVCAGFGRQGGIGRLLGLQAQGAEVLHQGEHVFELLAAGVAVQAHFEAQVAGLRVEAVELRHGPGEGLQAEDVAQPRQVAV